MLYRLVYVSTLAPEVGRPELDAIIERSASANAERGITGLLAVDEKRICQILEGPEREVECLFAAIREDARHADIVVLERREIPAPHFGKWGMARRRMVDIVTLAFTL